MIGKLQNLVNDMTTLNSKLVLLIGPPQSGKSALLAQLSERLDADVLHVGAMLGRKLVSMPSTRRHVQVSDLLKDLVDETAHEGILLLDNIELLFDRNLRLSPLDLLKRQAHARRVIAVWPGEIRESRLSYATTGHPEHQEYGIDGLVPFVID